jgi:membrane protein implicated in regulation of membrane protease activity
MSDRRKIDLGRAPGSSILPDGEDTPWMTWLALACAAIAFLAVYLAFPTIGMTIGAVLLALLALRVALYIWLSTPSGEPDSDRDAFLARAEQLTKNRAAAKSDSPETRL